MKDALVSTAGKNGDDAASGTGKSSGTDIGKASGKNAGGDSLNISRGDDIVSVSLKSDLCKELPSKGVYEESDKELHISSTYDENGYFMFQMCVPFTLFLFSNGEGTEVAQFDAASVVKKISLEEIDSRPGEGCEVKLHFPKKIAPE